MHNTTFKTTLQAFQHVSYVISVCHISINFSLKLLTNHLYGVFCRLSPQLSQEVMLDEVSDAILVDMMWETQMYLYEKRESLQSLARLLLDN